MKALRVEDMYSTATRLRLKARRSRDTRLPRELTVEHGRDLSRPSASLPTVKFTISWMQSDSRYGA